VRIFEMSFQEDYRPGAGHDGFGGFLFWNKQTRKKTGDMVMVSRWGSSHTSFFLKAENQGLIMLLPLPGERCPR
jgi:hypothetical protein